MSSQNHSGSNQTIEQTTCPNCGLALGHAVGCHYGYGEHRTSNPLLIASKCRERADVMRSQAFPETEETLRYAADEIERLTAELADALRVCSEWGAKEYTARAERSELAQRYLSAVAQITNLRAALERVQTTYQLTHVHELARTALSGSHSHPSSESAGGQRHSDETTDAQETVEVKRGAWVFVRTKWDTGRATVKVSGADFLVTRGAEGGVTPSENGDECRG